MYVMEMLIGPPNTLVPTDSGWFSHTAGTLLTVTAKTWAAEMRVGPEPIWERHPSRHVNDMKVGESNDFRPLAALGGADRETPFFAPVKEASIKTSSSCSFPRAWHLLRQNVRMRSRLPCRTHCWKRRWQVYGGYFLGSSRYCARVPNTQRIPLRAARVSRHGRPRPSMRSFGRKIASISCHWASLSSHRPRMPPF